MAQNRVEHHIKPDQRYTFSVKAGATLYAGDVVEITGDMEVGPASDASAKVLGVVYGGTVGNSAIPTFAGMPDHVNVGFSGDRKEKVTVILKSNLIYFKQPSDPLVAGNLVGAGPDGTYAVWSAGDVLGKVVSATSKVAGYGILALNI